MSLYPHKKELDNGFLTQADQDQIDNSSQNEKFPEFDEIGTPLNGI